MSSPVTTPNKETLKLLLPLQYDGKTIKECDRFLSQLRIYWLVNMLLTTIELKVQVALSLLDGDARAWATPYFTQLTSVQMGVQGITTPFRNEAAFTAAFKARFSNLDNEAVAQVELAKLCVDKVRRTVPGMGTWNYATSVVQSNSDSDIPFHVYRKIELKTFTTWKDAEKHATEVEQILDISWAHRPELNNFFCMRSRTQRGTWWCTLVTQSIGQHQCGRWKRKLPRQLLWLREARCHELARHLAIF
ncbi:predicted protein [Postia placenta Mad-698-R]|nr:predicted protein [Postia placenta Mad-698-R]